MFDEQHGGQHSSHNASSGSERGDHEYVGENGGIG